MADRYWIGGAGTWDGADTTHWSASSGGAGGASAPTVADNAIFDSSSGAGTVAAAATAAANNVTINLATITVQLGGNVTFAGLVTLTAGVIDLTTRTLTAFNIASSNSNARTLAFGTGQINLTGNGVNLIDFTTATNMTVTGTPIINCTYGGSASQRTIIMGSPAEANTISVNITAGTDTVQCGNRYRNLNFTGFSGTLNNTARSIYGNLTLSAGMTLNAGTSVTTLAATSGTQVITSNGKTMDFPVTVSAAGNTTRLADALTLGPTRAFTFGNGALLDLNGFTLSAGSFVSSNSNTRTIGLGSGGSIIVAGAGATAFSAAAAANLTFTGTGIISMTSASAKTFAGNTGVSWPTLNQGGAGTLTITGANTFADITNTVNGTTITLPASTTTTVGAFSLGGASGSVTTLQSSSAGSAATLSKTSGVVDASWLSIKDSAATGGATWRAPVNRGNVDVSGNSGWVFNPVGGTAKAGVGMGMGITL